MNLVQRLMKVDKKDLSAIGSKEIQSKRINDLLGEETAIKINAIDSGRYMSIQATALDKNGKVIYERVYDTNAKVVAAGLVEPDLKDAKLLEHLEVATPAEAAKKLFRGEVNSIAAEIALLSGFISEDETEAEIKN